MKVQIQRVVCLCAAMALPSAAWAEAPFNADMLAKLESALDFCAHRNPDAAAKYQALAKSLVQGVAEKEVTAIRKSEEYKEAFKSNVAALGEVSKDEVMEACNAFLESPK